MSNYALTAAYIVPRSRADNPSWEVGFSALGIRSSRVLRTVEREDGENSPKEGGVGEILKMLG